MTTAPALDEVRTEPLTRLYTGADGGSRFGTWQWPAVQAEIAPPAPPVIVTMPEAAGQTMLLRLPAGWSCEPHPAPHRHLMVVLHGTLESTTSDGETRRLPPGGAVLVEDTTGLGHGIRSVGGEVVVAITQLDGGTA